MIWSVAPSNTMMQIFRHAYEFFVFLQGRRYGALDESCEADFVLSRKCFTREFASLGWEEAPNFARNPRSDRPGVLGKSQSRGQ